MAKSRCLRLGCPYGAYVSTQSSTLPATMATSRLTLKPFAIASEVVRSRSRVRGLLGGPHSAKCYPITPGRGIHEMGTARMGKDPRSSVLNKHNQVWDALNVYVTDGA